MYGQRNSEKRPARTISRRRFVQGLVAGSVIAGLDLWRWPAVVRGTARDQEVLTGTQFALTIEQIPVNFTGYNTTATAINGSVPGPLLRWREGDTVTLSVTNHLSEDTSIHWHGIRMPADMDGVPGLSFPGIAPNETFVYQFPVRQSDTHWYHSHSRFHQQTYRPEATVLATAGDLTLEELEALAKKYFADWSVPGKTADALPGVSMRKESAALVINRPLVQASVRLVFVGAPAASPDIPALRLLSQLLAGSAESSLGQNLREQKQWVYSVRSAAEPFWQAGLFYIDMSIPYEVILPALQETVCEIARLQTAPVSAAELVRAKQEFTTRFAFETESIRDIAHFVAEREASTHRREPPDHVVEALRSVSAEEVQRVARTYLDPQKTIVTIEEDVQGIRQYAPALAEGKLPRWDSSWSGKEEER